MAKIFRFLLALLTIVFGTNGVVFGQAINATIVGTVTDHTGAVLPGVDIKITNLATNVGRATITDENGFYRVPELAPGAYSITAELIGFKRNRIEPIRLEINQTARVDLKMELGEITETVQIEAAAPLLESETSAMGAVIDNSTVVSLPLNGRNYLDLTKLVPGVTNSPGRGSEINQKVGSDFAIIINGQRSESISYLIDGVESRNLWVGSANLLPSIDGLQEFKVQQNAFSSEFGQGTAIINIAIKSGTNNLHGSLFEFHRNSRLDSTNFFTNLVGQKKDPLVWNQFGFTLGGPVKKDKTFFFGNYEGRRMRRSTTLLGTVPGERERAGDFSGGPIILDPSTTRPDPSSPGQFIRDPFLNNLIPNDRISQFARAALRYFPSPNTNVLAGGANFQRTVSDRNDFNNLAIKMDSSLSEKDSLNGHFAFHDQEVTQFNVMPLTGQIYPARSMNVGMSEVHTFSPTLLNEIRLGYNYGNITATQEVTREDVARTEFGLRNVERTPSFNGLPLINITGYSTLGSANGGYRPEGGKNHTFQIVEHLTATRGRNTMKVGTDIRHTRYRGLGGFLPRGNFAFSNRFTNNALADFLLGLPLQARAGLGTHTFLLQGTNYNFFMQNDFKIRRNLTLNAGIRYEYTTPFTDELDRLSIFSLQEQRFLLAGKDTSRGLLAPDRNNFAPRVGLAWSVGSDQKTVVRAGFGIFYGLVLFNERAFLNHNPPFLFNTTLDAALTQLVHTSDLFPEPPPVDQSTNPGKFPNPSMSFFTIEQRPATPYTQQWNLDIQREILPNLLLDIGYVGSHSVKLEGRQNPNQALPDPDPARPTPIPSRRPYPNFGRVTFTEAAYNSSYHALQIKLERRFTQGLSFLGSYAWSRNIDMQASTAGDSAQDSTNKRGDYGLSPNHSAHRFVFSTVYTLPIGHGRRFGTNWSSIANALLGGWQANAIITLQSGFPIDLRSANSNNMDGFNTRPNRVADGNLPKSERTISRFIDTSAFVLQPFGRFGNAGRNVVIGPGINNWDLSFFKDASLREGVRLQFRAELFNAFNHPQFLNPGTWTVGTPSYGRILAAAPARQIQMGLKLIF